MINYLKRIIKSILSLVKKSDTLIVGPYVGEFGWEIMEWIPYVRMIAKRYKRVIAISYTNSRYFYSNSEFFPTNLELGSSGFGFGEIPKSLEKKIISSCAQAYGLQHFDLFKPSFLNRISKFLIGKKKYLVYREDSLNMEIDILFHFRNFTREDGDYKNYPKEDCDKLVDNFVDKNFNVACIGHPKYSYCPKNASDLRSNDFKLTIAAMSASKLVVGGSSGPIHLACLCNKPIVTWISEEFGAERYRSYWNPFKVPVYIVSEKTFRPPKDQIIDNIQHALKEL